MRLMAVTVFIGQSTQISAFSLTNRKKKYKIIKIGNFIGQICKFI